MYVLFNAIHQDLGVPIVFVQLGPDPQWWARPYWADIQIVQGWIGERAPDWVRMVTAMDLSAARMPWPQEHLNQKSQITLGGRMEGRNVRATVGLVRDEFGPLMLNVKRQPSKEFVRVAVQLSYEVIDWVPGCAK